MTVVKNIVDDVDYLSWKNTIDPKLKQSINARFTRLALSK